MSKERVAPTGAAMVRADARENFVTEMRGRHRAARQGGIAWWWFRGSRERLLRNGLSRRARWRGVKGSCTAWRACAGGWRHALAAWLHPPMCAASVTSVTGLMPMRPWEWRCPPPVRWCGHGWLVNDTLQLEIVSLSSAEYAHHGFASSASTLFGYLSLSQDWRHLMCKVVRGRMQ